MDTIVIEAPAKSNVRNMLNFSKLNGTDVNSKVARKLSDDARFVSLIEELEDTVLVSLIEEGLKTEDVSLDEVMDFLNQ